MADCVAIAAELPFRSQIVDTLAHVLRSAQPPKRDSGREIMASFDSRLKPAEGETEPTVEAKRGVIKDVVAIYVETKGALEGLKESDPESAHLLLQHLLSTNFDIAKEEYSSLVKSVINAVVEGGQAAVAASRQSKAEIASRILGNTYNYLPAASPLRLSTLLALLTLLSASGDLSTLPLPNTQLTSILSQISVSDVERVQFLTSVAKTCADTTSPSGGDLGRAADAQTLALSYALDQSTVNSALATALAVPSRLDVDDVLKVQGVRDLVNGEIKELVELFSTEDEIEAVGKGQAWVSSHGKFLESFGIASLNGEEIIRKLRLIALATLCARSPSKQLKYSEIASALQVDEADVEAWVIDAISAKLIEARLSQPLSIVRIQSVSSRGTRRFGTEEWALLEKRLLAWKTAVAEASKVVEEAEALAAQGPATGQPRRQQGARRGGGGGQNAGAGASVGEESGRREEVVA